MKTKTGRPRLFSEPMTPLTVTMQPAVAAALRRLSDRTRVPQSAYVREGIDLVLKKHARVRSR